MELSSVSFAGRRVPVRRLDTLVLGSGAAALNAAVRLHGLGRTDVAIATERRGGGASRNSGSDKQTYYKLSIAGGEPDSPRRMAEDLFAGGAMHGDIALVEAQASLDAFFGLVRAGVPFPFDRYGGYVGYKTDHDPRQRATSAGPWTSRLMAEALDREVRRRRIPVLDRQLLIALVTAGRGTARRVAGALTLDLRRAGRGGAPDLLLFDAANVVLATGGPGGLYLRSVYPEDQRGAHGAVLAAGVPAANLAEGQFGLASVKFRWNLSGSYQQAVPRYFSTDAGGGDERELLAEAFPDMGRLATAIFLKGYQWPFDSRKVRDHGSSLIDLLVHRETEGRGRRVFLDFRENPRGGGRLKPFSLSSLAPEARAYLERSGATGAVPIDRLRALNPPALEVYRRRGIDLGREPLEAAVCHQHANGGFRANAWWESGLRGLFPVGEACGTHGVYRPGGSALNAGQVGGIRAAAFIAARRPAEPLPVREFLRAARPELERALDAMSAWSGAAGREALAPADAVLQVRTRMTRAAGIVRDREVVEREAAAAWALFRSLRRRLRVRSPRELPDAFRAADLALTSAVHLEALREYLAKGGGSRGSALVTDPGGEAAGPGLDEWRFRPDGAGAFVSGRVLEVRLDGRGRARTEWVPVRSLPDYDAWFESVWADFRAGRIVREED